MKKLLTFLVFLTLLSAAVFAAGGQPETTGQSDDAEANMPESAGNEDAPVPQLISAGPEAREMAQERAQIMAQNGSQNMVQNRAKLQTGLENALSNVKNENARQRLQQNMEAFQTRYQARLEGMEDVEVSDVDEETGAVQIRAKEQVKYLGFIKGTAAKRFNINAEGQIEEKAPWYRFMYSEMNQEGQE